MSREYTNSNGDHVVVSDHSGPLTGNNVEQVQVQNHETGKVGTSYDYTSNHNENEDRASDRSK